MDEYRETNLFWVGIAGVAPIAAAMALVPFRGVMLNTNVALILVAVVVAVAAGGGRQAGAVSAISAALAFDFFHTHPYLQLKIAAADDIETTVILFFVGLLVGHVAAGRRQARTSAFASHGEIRRIHRVAELAARGEDACDVILAAQAELTHLLHLDECRFEAPPFSHNLERLERTGVMSSPRYHLQRGGFELPPEGIALPVLGRGQVLGRFVLVPTPGTGVSLEERVVAIAIADQVGAVLAAPVRRG